MTFSTAHDVNVEDYNYLTFAKRLDQVDTHVNVSSFEFR